MARVQSLVSPVPDRSCTYDSSTTLMASPDDIRPAETYFKSEASSEARRPGHPWDVNANNQAHAESIPVQSAISKVSEYSVTSPCTLVESDNAFHSPTTNSTSPLPLPLIDSLGIAGCLSIVGGAIGILALLGFLTFLWFGHGSEPEARNASYLWRLFALRNWMVQAITVCALLLRLSISVQATVCTSMIAGLVLERHFTRRSCVAYFSIVRGVNSGPRELLQAMFKMRSRTLLSQVELWLLGLLVAVTVALQFSSTILLSDMHVFSIISNVNSTNVTSLLSRAWDLDERLGGAEMSAWTPVYAAYGEAQSVSSVKPSPRGLSDSGVLQRGFLPLTNTDARTAVRSYEGNAMVMSSRVACMRPVMTANFTGLLSPGDYLGYGYVEGVVDLDASLKEATGGSESISCETDGCRTAAYSCFLPGGIIDQRQASFCRLTEVGGNTYSFYTSWTPSEPPWVQNSSIYLGFATNMGINDWASLSESRFLNSGTPVEEWVSYDLQNKSIVNATLCFSASQMARQSVRMSTSGEVREPIINWTLTTATWNTSDVRNYLGVDGTNSTSEDRGILNMTILGPPDNGPVSIPENATSTVVINASLASDTEFEFNQIYTESLTSGGSYNMTYAGCMNCIIDAMVTHRENNMIWGDVIASTGRVTDAMQGWKTVVATTVYQAYLRSLGQPEAARMEATILVQTPGPCDVNTCAGYISITTLLVVHLICVGAITLLYARQVRYSRCGNIWHAVSQLVSRETVEILEKTNDLSDDNITQSLKLDANDGFVKLEKSNTDGRIDIVKYEHGVK